MVQIGKRDAPSALDKETAHPRRGATSGSPEGGIRRNALLRFCRITLVVGIGLTCAVMAFNALLATTGMGAALGASALASTAIYLYVQAIPLATVPASLLAVAGIFSTRRPGWWRGGIAGSALTIALCVIVNVASLVWMPLSFDFGVEDRLLSLVVAAHAFAFALLCWRNGIVEAPSLPVAPAKGSAGRALLGACGALVLIAMSIPNALAFRRSLLNYLSDPHWSTTHNGLDGAFGAISISVELALALLAVPAIACIIAAIRASWWRAIAVTAYAGLAIIGIGVAALSVGVTPTNLIQTSPFTALVAYACMVLPAMLLACANALAQRAAAISSS